MIAGRKLVKNQPTHQITQQKWVWVAVAVVYVLRILCKPKWSLSLPCTRDKCKCYCFNLFSSTGSAHTCCQRLLGESGQLLPRLDSHRESPVLLLLVLCIRCLISMTEIAHPLQDDRQSRGGRMAGETRIRTCTFFIPCWFESLFIIADCKLFPFCDFSVDARSIAIPVSSCSLSVCVSTLCKMPLPFLAILANRSLCGLENMFRTEGKWGEVA